MKGFNYYLNDVSFLVTLSMEKTHEIVQDNIIIHFSFVPGIPEPQAA